jgi:hypothetical protein
MAGKAGFLSPSMLCLLNSLFSFSYLSLFWGDVFSVHSFPVCDRNYSCCVDEVAAQHVDADAIVHYGHACMSQ